MTIVVTEIERIHADGNQRRIYYRCQDHLGQWHNYGPLNTSDAGFDAEGFKAVVAAKIALSLAETEVQQVLEQ